MNRGAGFGRRLRLRWVHLLLGGALLMPYFLLAVVVLGVIVPGVGVFTDLAWQLAAYLLCLPLVAGTALLFPLVRVLESAAARALCFGPQGPAVFADGAAVSWAARRRTAGWFTLHVGTGALVSGASLALPPASALLVLYPFVGSLRKMEWPWTRGIEVWTAPLAGIALLAALAALVYGTGALLDRCAPALLGPTPADRLALAERRAADLAARNRLARELHDSVGHALSAVTLQAAAARKVLDSDPEFARQALGAIEETTRSAVTELDTVLGVLREGEAGTGGRGERTAGERRAAGGPTLDADLEGLLKRTRATGVSVAYAPRPGTEAELTGLPEHLSREAYRIVQEGLTNVLRHAGEVPVELMIAVQSAGEEGELTVLMVNPLRRGGTPERTDEDGPRRGGRGLRGIEERAALLGGSAESGSRGESWRMSVRLPLRRADDAASTSAAPGAGSGGAE